MTCSACSSGLSKYLEKQPGIISANVNLVLSIATVEYENITKKEIEHYIRDAGFESLGEFNGIEDVDSNNSDKIKLIIFGVLVIFMMYISMGHMLSLPNIPFINYNYPIMFSTMLLFITFIFLWYGYDILKSGIKNLLHKMPNMDTLVMFSVVFSFLYSVYGYINIIKGNYSYVSSLYFESTCMVIYFIKLGRFIENINKDKTKDAIRKLVQITPKEAILKIDGKEKRVSIDEVEVDDILICRSGDKIAVDGVVVSGKTYVDESFITGESMPVEKLCGSSVIAGSISYDGYIDYIPFPSNIDYTPSYVIGFTNYDGDMTSTSTNNIIILYGSISNDTLSAKSMYAYGWSSNNLRIVGWINTDGFIRTSGSTKYLSLNNISGYRFPYGFRYSFYFFKDQIT